MEKQEEFNGQIKAIFRGGRVRKIDWGKEFHEWDDNSKLEYSMELASAMNQAADIMQTERNDLLKENATLKSSLTFSENALQTQKSIMTEQLISGNAQTQELSQMIQELQVRIKAQDKIIELKKQE